MATLNYMVIPGMYKKFDVDFNRVKLFVCEEFGITLEELHTKKTKNTKAIYAHPRMMCFYIGHYIYNLSYHKLALEFNINAHATVIHGVKNISNWLETDRNVLGKYLNILKKMENYGNIRREQGIPHIWDAHKYGEWIE